LPIIAIVILIILISIFIVAIPSFKLERQEFKKTGKHPKGHYQGRGIAMGLPIGISIGVAMGNIAIGVAIGVAIGLSIGAAQEKKHEKELRPLTDEEKRMKQRSRMLCMALFALGLVVFVTLFFMRQ